VKILNLYAGVGGNRKLWEGHQITAVEGNPQIAELYREFYPDDEVVIGDAHAYLLSHFEKFDFIWSSPPCQRNTKMMKATRHKIRKYPDLRLYEEVIFLDNFYQGAWVVENVVPYYEPLIPAKKVGRHLFWSNAEIQARDVERPAGFINRTTVEGKRALMDWLGIHYDKNIYYEGNHDPAQILRNCVHPLVGLDVLLTATKSLPR